MGSSIALCGAVGSGCCGCQLLSTHAVLQTGGDGIPLLWPCTHQCHQGRSALSLVLAAAHSAVMGVAVVWSFYQQANSNVNSKAAPFPATQGEVSSFAAAEGGGMGAVFGDSSCELSQRTLPSGLPVNKESVLSVPVCRLSFGSVWEHV